MKRIISFLFISGIILFSRMFWKCKVEYINSSKKEDVWEDVRIFVLLNHSSLFEPLLFSPIPLKYLWRYVHLMKIPGADITLERPIVGRIYKTIFPQITSITRKRDYSWAEFLESINDDSLIVIAPEGMMKREDGLDKLGNPMTIKSGIADVLGKLDSGNIVFAYSGGLHHVQFPGENKINFFKTIKVNYEKIGIKEFKQELNNDGDNEKSFHRAVVKNIEDRMNKNIPHLEGGIRKS